MFCWTGVVDVEGASARWNEGLGSSIITGCFLLAFAVGFDWAVALVAGTNRGGVLN